jgi:hypothetical protein
VILKQGRRKERCLYLFSSFFCIKHYILPATQEVVENADKCFGILSTLCSMEFVFWLTALLVIATQMTGSDFGFLGCLTVFPQISLHISNYHRLMFKTGTKYA